LYGGIVEGRLILWVLIISVIVRTEISYGWKVNIVGGDNIGILRTEISYGGKVIIVGGDNIGHCENRKFIWREGYYCGW
jgi:hypothetical protein